MEKEYAQELLKIKVFNKKSKVYLYFYITTFILTVIFNILNLEPAIWKTVTVICITVIGFFFSVFAITFKIKEYNIWHRISQLRLDKLGNEMELLKKNMIIK